MSLWYTPASDKPFLDLGMSDEEIEKAIAEVMARPGFLEELDREAELRAKPYTDGIEARRRRSHPCWLWLR